GPFGANGLTISSQVPRFAAFLETNGLLKDGRAITPSTKLPSESITQGYSFLGALREANGLDRLQPWFEGAEKDPFKSGTTDWSLSSGIATYLGFDTPQQPANYVNFTSNVPLSLDLSGSKRLVGPLQAMQNYNTANEQPSMTALYDQTILTIRLDTATYKVPLIELL